MSDFGFIPEQRTTRVRFEIAPIYNMLCSLCLLNQDHLDHISPWVDRVLAELEPGEKETAELACEAGMFVGDSAATTLDEFVRELRRRDPAELVQIDLERVREKAVRSLGTDDLPTVDTLRSDRDAYVGLIRRLKAAHEAEFRPEDAERAFDRLQNPTAYRNSIADALDHFWDRFLKDEWARVQADVADSVDAFRSVQVPATSLDEKLRFVTGRDFIPDEWLDMLSNAEEIVYVPSVHIGPYMILFEFDGRRAYIVGRARIPEGASVRSESLDRSDLLMRLDAISDSTRLRILELASRQGTVTAPEIMDALELSQSSASRHLAQLAATGLLSVDGTERTKKYQINPRRIDDVCEGLKQLIGGPR